MFKFTIFPLNLFVSEQVRMLSGSSFHSFAEKIFKRVQPMGCSPAQKFTANKGEPKHFLHFLST